MSTKKLVTGAMLLGAALLLAGCGHWGHGGRRDHGEYYRDHHGHGYEYAPAHGPRHEMNGYFATVPRDG